MKLIKIFLMLLSLFLIQFFRVLFNALVRLLVSEVVLVEHIKLPLLVLLIHLILNLFRNVVDLLDVQAFLLYHINHIALSPFQFFEDVLV